MQLSKAIEGFVFSKRADGRVAKTIEMYQWSLGYLANSLGDIDIARVTTPTLRDFYAALPSSEPPLSRRSIQIIHIHIGAWLKWLVEEGFIPHRPDANIQVPRAPDPGIQPFTEDEVRRMLKSAGFVKVTPSNRSAYEYRHPFGERNKAILLTLLSTGCRASELCNLTLGDVNLDTGEVRVKAHKTKYPRTTYLDNASRKSLWKYLTLRAESRSDEPLFLSDERGRMTPGGLYLLIRKIADRAGVENAHPHRWRHTFAVNWIVAGGDLARLRIIMGHRNISVTQRYLQIAQPDIQAAHIATSAGDRWRL